MYPFGQANVPQGVHVLQVGNLCGRRSNVSGAAKSAPSSTCIVYNIN